MTKKVKNTKTIIMTKKRKRKKEIRCHTIRYLLTETENQKVEDYAFGLGLSASVCMRSLALEKLAEKIGLPALIEKIISDNPTVLETIGKQYEETQELNT